MVTYDPIKFNEFVWHDKPYYHPQLRTQVPKDFYDRTGEKAVAERILRSLESRRAIIVVGERRAGKTLFLRLMADRLKRDPSGQFLPIIVPWHGIHSCIELFCEMVQGLCFDLNLEMPMLEPAVGCLISERCNNGRTRFQDLRPAKVCAGKDGCILYG